MSFDAISSLESGSSQFSQISDFLTGSSITEMIPTDSISNYIGQLSSTLHLILLVVAFVVSLLGCFFGYKLARLLMSLTGFVLGLIIGYYIFANSLALSGIPLYLATLASGVFLAAMSFWIYRAAVFMLCFIFAFAAAANVIPFTNDVQFFLCTLVGFIVGAISQKFLRAVIIFTSAVTCGMWAGFNAIRLADLLHLGIPTNEFYSLLVGVVFVVCGVFIQFLTTKEPIKKEPVKLIKKQKTEQ